MDQNWCTRKNVGGQNLGNFQLHRFTTSENIIKKVSGATFLTCTVYVCVTEILWSI